MQKGEKKGQTTIFLTVGAIILFSVLFYFAISSFKKEIPTPITADTLSACTENSIKEVFFTIALSGGYALFPEDALETPLGEIPAYKQAPTEKEVVDALEQEAKEVVVSCMAGLKKEEKDIGVTMALSPLNTRTVVTYPVVLVQEGQEREAPPISVQYPARIQTLHKVASQIMEAIKDDPLTVPSSKLLDIEEKEKVNINVLWDDNNVVYFITDKAPDALELTWAFAVRK